jgi:SpoIID/LytB domain protein
VAAAALTLLTGAAGLLVGTATPAAAYPMASLELIGHGYGHGIGMGQWGSLGYALGDDGGAGNFTYQQILDYYYGGTSLQTLGTAPAPPSIHGGDVIVAMQQNDGNNLIATAASGSVNVPGGSTATAVEVVPMPGSSTMFNVFTGSGCGGPWSGPVVGGLATPTFSAVGGGAMDICESGPSIEVHGSVGELFNSDAQTRTINTLPLEQYVADVAPAESPTYWASLGGPGPQGQNWGFQQSEAQTVAARSYVESSPMGYGGYADTCDQSCQAYPGMADETSTSLAAAADTAGQVMVTDNTSLVADTEYSASSGGYSTGDQFPAVPDAGDGICIPQACNPNHDWTASIPVSAIDATYPQIGTLESFDVTERNGLGDFGGRVEMLTLQGSSGSVSMTGDQFAATFNLDSDWYTVSDQPSGGVGGYWINASDGGVFSFGNAQFYGSTGNIVLNKPMVGMAATPDGRGYWLVASDGGIFSFGDAQFYGSTGNLVLNKPIVGMVPTHDGRGYWLIASDGGLFAFGDATYDGSLPGSHIVPPEPIVGVAPTPDGGGYWMLAGNGTVYNFGDAPAGLQPGADSPSISLANSPMSAMIPDLTGEGFDVVDQTGQAFAFGDAPYFGDVASTINGYSGHVVGIAVSPG